MKPLFSVGLLVVGLSAGIVIGKATTRGVSGPEQTGLDVTDKRSGKRERSPRADSPTNNIDRIRKAKPAELPSLTRNAIHLSDPVEMRRQLTECLLHMDASNWQEVVDAFAKLSRETGRDQADEWKLSLFRSGQVAGEQAMNLRLKDGLDKKSDSNWHTLYGWSTKDSHAALAWLRKAEADGHPASNEYYGAIIAGAALTNPQDALKLLTEIPQERRQGCAGHLVWNTVQNGGTQALEQVLQYASTLDASQPGNATLAANLFGEATEKLLWKADHALSSVQATEVVLKLTALGQDPTATTQQALRKFRYYGMSEKLNIIETVRTAPQSSELDLPSLASTVLNGLNEGNGDVAVIRGWMNQHPDSPLVPMLEKRVSRGE